MKRATATAFALVLAASAGGAGAQTVLWGGGSPSPAPAPTTPSAPPIYTGPSASPRYGAPSTPPIYTPPPAAAAPAPGPVTPPPAAGSGSGSGSGSAVIGFPPAAPGYSAPETPRPAAGGATILGPSAAAPPQPSQPSSSAGGGAGWPGGYGRWDRERDSEPSYNAWRGDEAERARELVRRLDRLIQAAERQRAADPEFLRDLRELTQRYEAGSDLGGGRGETRPGLRPIPRPDATAILEPPRPNPTILPPIQPPAPPPARVAMSDDFVDGDFTRGTVWTPRQGQWRVDPFNGLRSVRPAAPQVLRRQISPQELLQALLVGPQSLGLGPQEAPPNAALIEYAQTLPNAFTLRARVTDHGGDGAVHLIVHQGGVNWNGYRLDLRGGPDGRAVLTRRGASGYTDLANAPLRRFAANVPHDVEWSRASNGAMSVRVDGELLFTVADAAFRDNWRGFAFFNAGGDYSMRSISIEEAR